MSTRLRESFQRALTASLRRGLVTPHGTIDADGRPFKFGSPSGAFEPVDVWAYRRARSGHEMMFGFVPYGGDVALFSSVGFGPGAFHSGDGATVQLNLRPERGLVGRSRRIELRHQGNVTLGRGAVKREVLADLIQRAAPEAARGLGGIRSDTWPITLGDTSSVADLIDRLFLYCFALEQAKRLLSQQRRAADRRRTKVLELLPRLDAAGEEEDDPRDDDERSPTRGQGRLLTVEQRLAIEQYAVKLATEYFVGMGYTVRELGKPYDLECTRDREVLHVEVKGTSGAGETIEVTAGEVRHAQKRKVALFIVSEIEIDGSKPPHGGQRWVCEHWQPRPHELEPIHYRHVIDHRRGRFLR